MAVAEEQSFTRAAARLHVAQPPLSRQIQQLETELGVVLIERGSRPSRLTDAGRVLFEQSVQILDRVAEMRTIARRLTEAKLRRFSIGFVPSTLYGYLPDILRDFRIARPDTEIAVVEMTSLEQITALKESRIDVGFGRIPYDDAEISRQLLRNEKLVAALPIHHRHQALKRALRLEDLVDDTLIVYPRSPRPSYADQVITLFRGAGLRPAALQEVRELQTALGLVAAGLGVCLVPSSVQRLQRDGVRYRVLEGDASSPIIMSHRIGDTSGDLVLILEIIKAVYRREKLLFGI